MNGPIHLWQEDNKSLVSLSTPRPSAMSKAWTTLMNTVLMVGQHDRSWCLIRLHALDSIPDDLLEERGFQGGRVNRREMERVEADRVRMSRGLPKDTDEVFACHSTHVVPRCGLVVPVAKTEDVVPPSPMTGEALEELRVSLSLADPGDARFLPGDDPLQGSQAKRLLLKLTAEPRFRFRESS